MTHSSLVEVREMLGHSSIVTTARYCHVVMSDPRVTRHVAG